MIRFVKLGKNGSFRIFGIIFSQLDQHFSSFPRWPTVGGAPLFPVTMSLILQKTYGTSHSQRRQLDKRAKEKSFELMVVPGVETAGKCCRTRV